MSSERSVTHVSGPNNEIIGGRTRTRTLDPLIKSQLSTRGNKDLAVKYRQTRALNINGLQTECKMDAHTSAKRLRRIRSGVF
jgi:hypothetical protein